ncbi:MAG TPA: hypothetical protein VLX85_06045 [Stellaceae bacterium]|nr:hypothetical protein [Stellaceae bacterium]
MADVAGGTLTALLNAISAVAGLGTAAMGLVDSSKAIMGGPSNFGFGHIKRAVTPFINGAGTAFTATQIEHTLKANWLNGVATADQKAKAKSLIHLGLAPGTAETLAKAAGVDAAKLTSLATKLATGAEASQDEINVLGQFDAVVSAVLDDAYERGDQIYRNACKLLSMAVSTVLAVVAGWAIAGGADYFTTSKFPIALIVGLGATPLAPVAKDLASALQTAANAVGTVKRKAGS